MAIERIDKVIASQGEYSRKQVKELIKKRAVLLNGNPVKTAQTKLDPNQDTVTIYGKPLVFKRHLYIMLNKPQGVVSATEDTRMKTVIDLLPPHLRRKNLFPAGRLDKDTEGFVLITDDGDFAHQILSPKKHIPKTYEVKVDGPIDEQMINAFLEGVKLSEEICCQPAVLEIVDDELSRVTIYEGMYHQIKRMFAAFDRKVIFLKRIKMGQLFLDEDLKPGECRELTPEEVQRICMKRV